jgi:hypothetical protein
MDERNIAQPHPSAKHYTSEKAVDVALDGGSNFHRAAVPALPRSLAPSNRFNMPNPKSNREYIAIQLASNTRSLKFLLELRVSVRPACVLSISERYLAPRPDSITFAVSNKTAKSSITDRCLM